LKKAQADKVRVVGVATPDEREGLMRALRDRNWQTDSEKVLSEDCFQLILSLSADEIPVFRHFLESHTASWGMASSIDCLRLVGSGIDLRRPLKAQIEKARQTEVQASLDASGLAHAQVIT
jgi:hypothetical protein